MSSPTLRFAGAPHNDLADLMVLPGYEQAAARAAVDALAAAAELGRSVQLEDVDPDGSLADADPVGQALTWAPDDPAPTIDLQGGWVRAISRRRSKRWHRALRQLREQHFVEFRWLEGYDAVDALPDFVRLRIARLRATGRPLGRPRVWGFVERVIQQLAPLGQCAFAEMRIDHRPVALDLHVIQRPVSMLWLRALDPAWPRFPCGHLLLLTTAERLGQTGYGTLDLGRGDEPYKFIFGAQRRTLRKATLAPHGSSIALAHHGQQTPE
jgi:CelD/BcsL family acetyltransferase involved in cellulose biosynthesis